MIARRTRRRLRLVSGRGGVGYGDRMAARPRITASALGIGVGVAGWVVGGPVAAIVSAVYAVVGFVGWLGIRRDRIRARDWSRALDALVELAGDLRAGLPPARALASAEPRLISAPRIGERVVVALRVAEATGAPLADLVERLELDLRSQEQARQRAAAHAAGTRATAALLAVLPLAGIGVGYLMGADPLRVLLRTPLGAGCAIVAVGLQLAGLAWTVRLSRGPADPP